MAISRPIPCGEQFGTLYGDTTGSNNTVNGYRAPTTYSSGYVNSAFGAYALSSNTDGYYNTAISAVALDSNTTGQSNTALGHYALGVNQTGSNNIAIGAAAGSDLTTGSYNIDIGNAGVAAESDLSRIGAALGARRTQGCRPMMSSVGVHVSVPVSSSRAKGSVHWRPAGR